MIQNQQRKILMNKKSSSQTFI